MELQLHKVMDYRYEISLIPTSLYKQTIKIDGFVKSPTGAKRCILRFFNVRKVRIITQDLRALPIFTIGELLYFAIRI